MKLITATLASTLALALVAPAQAHAQAPAQKPAATTAAAKPRDLKLTPKAQPAILALQTAVKAKTAATIPDLVAKANAVAKTPDDRYAIGTLQLQAAVDTNDYAGLIVAADVMMADGGTPAETNKIYLFASQKFNEAGNFPAATAALDKAIAGEPANGDMHLQRSEILFKQKRVPESLASLSEAISRTKASGQTVPETWYSVRARRAYDAKLISTYGYARDWVTAYPSPQHWRDSINMYRNLTGQDRAAAVDMLRLARANKALTGDGDYVGWSESLIARGYPIEALALLQEGGADGAIKLTSPGIAQVLANAKAKAPGARGVMAQVNKMALSDPNARLAMRAGDGAFDAGDYAQATTLYRAAMGKAGVDKDLANLRLGMALAMSGDKAGATTSLGAVSGAQAEVAKYWMTYLALKA